ncbi:MAG: hypothetical protein JO055_13670 [Alphaproteobacteria bacterium]|nr:hypothetical protein [Alphaproteobacteria bacterium]
MSKDRSRAVLAILVALPLWAAAGTASATDAPSVADVGAGIDYTLQPPANTAPVEVGAANAIDLLTRPITRALPAARPALQALVPSLTSGWRGLRLPNAVDSAALATSRSSDEWVSKSPSYKGPKPYVRFSEEERVLGLSFKIQPPPQAPEVASPSL